MSTTQNLTQDLKDNEQVKELLKLLTKVEQDRAHEFSGVINYVDTVGKQFNQVSQELQAVKAQLAAMQTPPAPVKAWQAETEDKVHQAKEQLHKVKNTIIQNAAQTVDKVKQVGISGLNKMVSFLGINESLTAMRSGLLSSIQSTSNQIEKIEAVGKELRSAGGHLQNVGRAATGNELKEITGDNEGRIAKTILAPLRNTRNILLDIDKATVGAIKHLEKLEKASTHTKTQSIPQNVKISKEEEQTKPSVRCKLQKVKEGQKKPEKQAVQKNHEKNISVKKASVSI